MAGATEIYLCKPGQQIKQGRVEYSEDIDTRAAAQNDAIQRCKWDKNLAKIAYYAVSEDGDFRSIYTYNNPNIGNDEVDKEIPQKKKKKPVKKTGLMSWMANAMGGSGSGKKKRKKKKS